MASPQPTPSPSPTPTPPSPQDPDQFTDIPAYPIKELNVKALLDYFAEISKVVDRDCDGISDYDDNCPTVPNPDQKDSNSNRMGDACESREITLIEALIQRQAKRLHAFETVGGREVFNYDMNGDGNKDIVVLYELAGFGGEDDYREYAALLLAGRGGYRVVSNVVIAGTNIRSIQQLSDNPYGDGTVTYLGREYAPSDQRCCPSIDHLIELSYRRGRLQVRSRKLE